MLIFASCGCSYVECAWQVPKLIDELASQLPNYPAVRAYLDLEHEAPSFTVRFAFGFRLFFLPSQVSLSHCRFSEWTLLSYKGFQLGHELHTSSLNRGALMFIVIT